MKNPNATKPRMIAFILILRRNFFSSTIFRLKA